MTDSSRHSLLLTSLHMSRSRQVYILQRSITGFLVVQEATCTQAHEYRLLGASCYYYFHFFIFGVTFVHANLCMHILASTCQDGGNPFPVIRLPVVNSVTDSSRHTLRLPALHSQWSRQVYIIHRSITGFLVVQGPTCTHAHEYRLLGASCFVIVNKTITKFSNLIDLMNRPYCLNAIPGLLEVRDTYKRSYRTVEK